MCLFASRPLLAQGESPSSETEPPPTFSYTTPSKPEPLRAVLETGGVLAVGFAWYATTSRDIVHDWDVGYRWSTFRRKITGQAFGPDTNHFGTNFIGHPLGGTAYYLAARSNRLTILQSLGFAAAGSLTWELFGEVSEVVSMNDTLVTPLGGLAVGEAMTQLAAYFDRSEPTSSHRILGAAFGPMKTLNDRFDGLEPARHSRTVPAREWHRFDLALGAALVRQTPIPGEHDALAAPGVDAHFLASSHLVRLPGYTSSGRGSLWFDDANVSRMSLEGAVGSPGLTDLAFESRVVLAGGYYRARTRDRAGAGWGSNGFAGISTAFEYTLHDYGRHDAGAVDRIASVQPLGISFEQRGALGGPEVTTRLEAGPSFGGVTPHAIHEFDGDRSRLPPVLVARDYYFGLGGHLTTGLGVEALGVEVGAEFQAEGYRAVGGPRQSVDTRLEDVRTRLTAELGYRVPETSVKPLVFVTRRTRAGRAGAARTRTGELTLGAELGAVF